MLATQNPIEQEGTYPLPEAQVDRFMLKVKVGYPDREEEREIIDRMSNEEQPRASRRGRRRTSILRAAQGGRRGLHGRQRQGLHRRLVFATREPAEYGLDIGPLIEYGASPRATLSLALAARAHAFLRARGYVTPEDVKAIGPDVLRHRVILTYEAEAENVTPEEVVQRIFETVEVP